MKWLLTGDWQTKFSNLKEVKQAHEQELAIIKEHKIKGHIDLGDLKDEYSPVAVEVVETQFARTKAIFDLIDPRNTIKLLGNHDRIGQHSDERNWLHLFSYLGGHIIEKPDMILCNELAIFGLPFTRNIKKFLKGSDNLAAAAKKVEHRKILIFHQEVKHARFNKLRGRPSDSRITLKGLHTETYDQVFGGHIHLRQKLAKNVRYVGNPFANDWGEVDQRKGFTIYDDITNKVIFIPSVVPGRYSYAYLQKNHIKEVSDGTQIKDTVICSSVISEYHKSLERKIREVSKAYPNALVQVTPKFENVDGAIEEVSAHSSESENLRLYIHASLPLALKEGKKKAVAYLQSILERSLGRRVRTTDKVVFEKVEASNVLSFERVKFDFRQRGTILITGVNSSGGVLASNGAGKTNFLSLPCIALEGRTFKGQQHDRWANWRTKSPAVLTQQLRISNGDKLTIERGRRPGKLQMSKNGKDISEGKTQAQVQKQIEELTGFTYDTLSNSVYIDQTLSNAFISGTDKTRAELIARFQNLDKFEFAKELAAKDLKKIKASEAETEYEIGLLRETLHEKKQDLKHHTKVVDEKKEAIQKELDEEKKIQELQERTLVARVKKWKSELEDIDIKNSKLSNEDRDISSKLYMTRTLIDNAKKKLSTLGDAKKCAMCLRPITEDVRKKMIAQVTEEREAQDKKLRELIVINEKLMYAIAKYKDRAEKLGKKIRLNTELTAGGYRHIQSLEQKLKAIRYVEREDDKRSRAERSISRTKSKIRANKKFLVDLDTQRMIVEFAIETFSRKGFPAFLSKLVCPVLNKASEHYSDLFLDGEIKVLFDVVNDSITPKIINVNGDREIEGQSQGEKAWAGLIASFALREIAQPSNLLILDEPGNGLDASGASRFGEKIRKLEKRFDTILVTTHNVHLAAALEGVTSLEIIKDNKISRIRTAI